MRRLRVLIVEDSPVLRELVRASIAADARLEVAALAGSAEEALTLLPTLRPDIITMDIRLPGMNGFDATRQIMREQPTPIVVVAGGVNAGDLDICMQALRAGALAVIEKPGADHAGFGRTLCDQLVAMSQVRLIRQRGPGAGRARVAVPHHAGTASRAGRHYSVVAIAASTGGPQALAILLQGLGADFPLPVLLVQHIGSAFTASFASWLDSVIPFKVLFADNGERPVAGHVYLAPPDRHLVIEAGLLRIQMEPPESQQRPSATVLLRSVAASEGRRGLGVVLTGMGEDGAHGLLELRRQGGHTIAEDASTAVVYGMPSAAVRLGAIDESLPLPAIAPRLRALVAGPRTTRTALTPS